MREPPEQSGTMPGTLAPLLPACGEKAGMGGGAGSRRAANRPRPSPRPSPRKRGEGVSCAIGVISGTSMDGIDVALIASDGEARIETGPVATFP
jgi:hypothetical protein